MKALEGQKRVAIENVYPQIDCGKHPIKRIINEPINVRADIFVDGHDLVKASLLHRKSQKGKESKWNEIPMNFISNDQWQSTFIPDSEGAYEYTIEAWVDHFSTWQHGLKKKFEDHQDIRNELLIGAELMEKASMNASKTQKKKLEQSIDLFRTNKNEAKTVSYALSETVSSLMQGLYDRAKVMRYSKILPVKVERKLVLFSAWYEFFPRSTSLTEGQHGTFEDCERILPEVAKMGFDVVYLPPIHPIGTSNRKGLNNVPTAQPGNPGSPWAIGSKEGGHKAIHPELGTFEDFASLVRKAGELDIKIALDFAIQCSPDHPYVKKYPDWFKWRPDGTVQYAENPPKKYQDVLPVNFETEDWENLWKEMKSIVDFWIGKGVRIFRVDNPHTKPFRFWGWLIKEVHAKNPDIIFLAEAFTRPRIMEQLAKVGFNQSYTYFTWRNNKEELQEYLIELTKTERREYFRPNFWPNTPDILPISLENKGESSFMIRLILAATLSSNYGIYGPLFELGVNKAYPGKEEYIDSEKYEIKLWDWNRSTRIKELITSINEIRRENKALQSTWNIEFHETDNSQLFCYSKTDEDNKLLIIVSLDPVYTQAGWVKVPLEYFGLKNRGPFVVHDLISGEQYTWRSEWNYIELRPQSMPAHLFRVEGI
ncbi:MAG: alpha-1,4-glucan--maltose-1-phosphate maltosyltransferase [Anditalea sp.]